MKARRKGDTAPFDDVYQIIIGRGLNAKHIPINDVEFEQQQEPTPDHWQDLRDKAAIAAMQAVMNFFGSIDYNRETIAEMAVKQADALVVKLKGG